MKLTNRQKQALHSAARACGVDEDMRRTIQWNVGGFYSAADATCTREGFIAVMAYYEVHNNGQLPGFTRGYWQGQDRKSSPLDAGRHYVLQLAAGLGLSREKLDEFIRGPHMSSGQFRGLDDLSAAWLHKLAEALKAIARRRGTEKRTA
ncbi:MAG: hypothetical protein PHU85_18805 [Phycisphaerae bacterium]|nr:hypothetical protein [Phycisphaerae bacterium]